MIAIVMPANKSLSDLTDTNGSLGTRSITSGVCATGIVDADGNSVPDMGTDCHGHGVETVQEGVRLVIFAWWDGSNLPPGEEEAEKVTQQTFESDSVESESSFYDWLTGWFA